MTLNQRGLRKLKEWIALLERDGWSLDDRKFLIDYWIEHHDEDGAVIAKGHPLYVEKQPSAASSQEGSTK